MTAFGISVFEAIVTSVLTAGVVSLFAMMWRFIRAQRKVNTSTSLANRSVQRDVLYRYFRIVVEEGRHITPEEYAHVTECYNAYHANGGNGAVTIMFERIKEHAVIDTGRETL